MGRKALAITVAAGMSLAAAGTALTDETDWGIYQVDDKRSGYTFAKAETRAIQDDEFDNPAFLWVDYGEELWNTADGEAGKACASCHEDAAESMAAVGATYPVFFEPWGKLINVEQRINQCRTENMKAKAFKWESREMLGMTAFVKNQSLGAPVSVKIDGSAAPFYEKGKAFYYERRGQLDMACKHCHEDNAGNMIRANILSQGQSNGFPTYRLKWQGLGSLHRRFRGCNKQVRAIPFGFGSDEYVNLELFLAHRGQGLPVETPSVRN
ncbi:MAG: sulfur oxidation c-type cytochrome SoxA [Kiloniellales bacterium]|nr:sulfur oxidation c-type cytochrome SoxA [Kiloniellales bacterium]